MRRSTALAAVATVSIILAGSAAQDDADAPRGRKYQNVQWYTLTHIAFYPKHTEDALEIIHEHFVPAGLAAGGPMPRMLEYATGGAWDFCMLWPLTGGPADLEWEVAPENIAWFNALAEQMGGVAEAEALLDEYMSMVKDYEKQLVRERLR